MKVALTGAAGFIGSNLAERLVASYDHDVTQAEWALGWRWDIVVGGAAATTFESGP